jgi:hypothetical protein
MGDKNRTNSKAAATASASAAATAAESFKWPSEEKEAISAARQKTGRGWGCEGIDLDIEI